MGNCEVVSGHRDLQSFCLTNRNSRVEHSLHAGAAPSWIRACLIVCFFFCCPWQCSQLLCCFPHLWALESKRNGAFQSWDIAKEEWETWSVLLLCFSHHTQKHDSTPAFIVAPTRASLDFPSPCLSCAAITWNSEGNLTAELVTHSGAFSSAESWSAYLDSDTQFPICQEKYSYNHHHLTGNGKEVWKKAGPLKLPLLGYVWDAQHLLPVLAAQKVS